jgi:hypothetical protein
MAVGMDAPEPTAGHPLGHRPGPPSKMDTLVWSAGRRERTPRRTATATDRMAGRVLLVVCSRPSVRVGQGARMTYDSVRPGRRSGLVSEWCPAVQGGSVHPTAMVRVMVKRLARPSPSRPCERPAWPHDAIRRFLALELDAEEGRPGRDPRSIQRSFQRYLRGQRRPSGDQMGRLRRLARGRIANRRGERCGHGHRRPCAAAVFPAGGSAGAPAGRGGEPASGVVSSYRTS